MSATQTQTMVVEPAQPRVVSLSVVSDMNCPWCYVGSKELLKAMQAACNATSTAAKEDAAKRPLQFKLEYKPFMLDPTLKVDEPVAREGRLEKKYGAERVKKAKELLDERAKDLGIDFKWTGNMRQTTASHRLMLRILKQHGSKAQLQLLEQLFIYNFEQAKDIGEYDLLAEIVEKLGFGSREETLEFLNSEELLPEVSNQIKEAQMLGISGVPFTVIDGKWAVSGGQSWDVYYKIFENLSEGKNP
jgi:predicted DsbA family dithiol-disulfide isomerase